MQVAKNPVATALALFLAFVLSFSLLPCAAFAQDDSGVMQDTQLQAAQVQVQADDQEAQEPQAQEQEPQAQDTAALATQGAAAENQYAPQVTQTTYYATFKDGKLTVSKFNTNISNPSLIVNIERGQTLSSAFALQAAPKNLTYDDVTSIEIADSLSENGDSIVGQEAFAGYFSAFKNCTSITGLDNLKLQDATGAYVISLARMFQGCETLTSIDISSFGQDTKYVSDMSYMFAGCTKLTNIQGLSTMSTAALENMTGMFTGCKAMTSIDLSTFNMAGLYSGDSIEYGCVTNSLFLSCDNLQEIKFPSRVKMKNAASPTSDVQGAAETFADCPKLTTIDLSNVDTSLMRNFTAMFKNCTSLTQVILGAGFNTSNATSMASMFENCIWLSSFDTGRLNMANVTDASLMFADCVNMKTINFSTMNMGVMTNMSNILKGCAGVQTFITGSGFVFKSGASLPYSTGWWKSGSTYLKYNTITGAGTWVYTTSGPPAAPSYTPPAPQVTTSPMYRVYNKYSGEHLFIGDQKEFKTLIKAGWKNEGVAWNAPSSGTPVYRLYNKWSGDHHYTTDKAEYDKCRKGGWKGEGVVFYSGGSKQVLRLYNKYVTSFYHHYTMDVAEFKACIKQGWKSEGIGWYGY